MSGVNTPSTRSSGLTSPSSLPPISPGSEQVYVHRRGGGRSPLLASNVVGFVCCDTNIFHSCDSVVPSRVAKMQTRLPSATMKCQLQPDYILSSLRFDTLLHSATSCILQTTGNELAHALKSIVRLSNLDQIGLIRSVLVSQKSKFNIRTDGPKISVSLITDQRKWRYRDAADLTSLSLSSDKSLFQRDLQQRKTFDGNIFALSNWYHSSNSMERKEFLIGLISQMNLSAIRLFNDVIADGQYRDFLRNLPEFLVKRILSNLNAASRAKLSMVNHSYYQLIDSMKTPDDSSTVTRLIELDNPMPNVPSFQKAFVEVRSRENFRAGKYCRVTELDGHIGRVLCVTIWRNYVACGGADKTIRVWSVNKGKLVCALQGHQGGVWCLQFFAKNLLMSGAYDSTIRLWSIKKSRCIRELKGHTGPVWGLKVEGNCMLSGSQDKLGIIWDAVRGEPLQYLAGHKQAIFAVDLCVADSLAITGSADKTVRLWSIEDGAHLKTINVGSLMSVTAVAYSRGFVAAASFITVKIYQIENAKPVVIAQKEKDEGQEQLVKLHRNVNAVSHGIEFAEEHTHRIESLSFRISNSNRNQLDGVLITSGKDGLVKYWDLSQKTSIQTFKPLNGGVVNSLYFDAYRVAVAGENSKVRVYDFSLSSENLAREGFQSLPSHSKKGSASTKFTPSTSRRSVTFIGEVAAE